MEEKKMTSIGGQAVIEGVMMRGPHKTAVAVRKPDGEIIIDESENKIKGGVRKIPLVRGVFAFVDSMVTGVKALMFSANFYDEDGNHIRTTISDYTFSPLVEYAEKEVIYTYDEYGNCTSYRFYQNDSGTRTFIEGYEYVITPVDVTPEAALRLMECRPQTPFWLST